ncbi:radical SAM protein [Anaerocolumna cellulosilytica]|uniref:Radical SAM protein n=2 Tax=Anaerocolumna cellulosilytica TaxID=433286 RepID=A0A6S6QX04_9FIRM|nr:radical SAM protein [Anaerocolumna cellulosilytica]BCJ95154.1 radical SAM protein [Anaerocolumna cellulosilytica]
MNQEFNLNEYLSEGIDNIVKGAFQATLTNPRESAFIAKFSIDSKKAASLRKKIEMEGEHIPPFLIASITSKCNLHCKGCYARANHTCIDTDMEDLLEVSDWEAVFFQAAQIGISFILIAGGEPLMRRDVIRTAADFKNILFPIFTNGTIIDREYLQLFHQNRNLLPVLSLEGDEKTTEERRGEGVAQVLAVAMASMKKKGIFYGVSITVTKNNLKMVTEENFLKSICESGCKLVFYIEYVPADEKSVEIAPTEEERSYLEQKLLELRVKYSDMIFISFPGDEKGTGGCLAAGRGFFHINPAGGAEPCPFSPYSDSSLKTMSLRDALKSPLFRKLKDSQLLKSEHTGGCVLFEQRESVKDFLN